MIPTVHTVYPSAPRPYVELDGDFITIQAWHYREAPAEVQFVITKNGGR